MDALVQELSRSYTFEDHVLVWPGLLTFDGLFGVLAKTKQCLLSSTMMLGYTPQVCERVVAEPPPEYSPSSPSPSELPYLTRSFVREYVNPRIVIQEATILDVDGDVEDEAEDARVDAASRLRAEGRDDDEEWLNPNDFLYYENKLLALIVSRDEERFPYPLLIRYGCTDWLKNEHVMNVMFT